MLTDELVKRLAARTGETPNILAPQIPDWSDGKGKTLSVAGLHLRQMGQGIIDEIHEHRHLREARVLLVVEDSEAVADKLDAGQRVVIGKASRANPFVRLLTMPGETATAASRQVAAVEDLLDGCIREARRLTRTGRRDRVRSLVVERLRVVALLASKHPEQLTDWIDRLMSQQGKAVR